MIAVASIRCRLIALAEQGANGVEHFAGTMTFTLYAVGPPQSS